MIDWKLTDKTDATFDVIDQEGWYSAFVKWDGCVEFQSYFNNPKHLQTPEDLQDNVDQIHICDIDEMIEILQSLKKVAQEYFGKDWPEI